ncbi:acyloxyacyl hydrolase [Flaviaesturariibacter flavus]|uniref:acyloxyacyl hydrolase n=1 Tax=Flaviaesturariibacter flavus TaxID=2502780 RepID=UPI0014050B58|nr:acyloxyacyl hydrolase [Flaviaesturariibacter flavus]
MLLPLLAALRGHSQAPEYAAGGAFHLGSFITKMSKADVLKDSYSSFVQGEWSASTPLSARTRLGATLLHGNSGGKRYLGTVSAALGFADRPLLGHRAWRLHGRLAAGLGWIGKPYDPETNFKNTLLGSHLNAAVQLSVYQELRIGRHWSWNSGVSFLHLSNGLSTLPNLGLNIPALHTGVLYRWAAPPMPQGAADSLPDGRNRWQLWASAGLKQWPLVNSRRHLVSVLSIEWHRYTLRGSSWGAQAQVLRDASPNAPTDSTLKAPGAGGFAAALGAHYTPRIGRLEIPLQAGVYVFNRRDSNRVYQSLGIRYRVARRWRAGIQLKTHMGKADYFHAGIGYEW